MTAPDEHLSPSPTFAEAWHAWFEYRCGGLRPLRLGTIDGYGSLWRCHIRSRLGSTSLSEIDAITIARLVVDLSTDGVSAIQVSKSLGMVRACLRWHYRMGTFAVDPTPWFDAPPPLSIERTIITLAEVERLIAAVPEYYRPMVTFSAYTGVRLGELIAITWADIDVEARTVRIDKSLYRGHLQRSTKSGYNRVVPIPVHVVEVLRQWQPRCPDPSPAGLAFPDPSGEALNVGRFRSRVWYPAVREADLPPGFRIHDLRHTSASLYLHYGATVREVMEIHGWRKLETAQRYLHTGEPLAVAAERLSDAWEAEGRTESSTS